MEISAMIISIVALILSLLQFIFNSNREKNESTLVAYNELQNEVFSKLNTIFIFYDNEFSDFEENGEYWEDVTTYLAKIERFCVGINTHIYSINILNRLGGGYFIRIFETLKPVINKKRIKNISKGKHYDEFEKTVTKLRKKRGLIQKWFYLLIFNNFKILGGLIWELTIVQQLY